MPSYLLRENKNKKKRTALYGEWLYLASMHDKDIATEVYGKVNIRQLFKKQKQFEVASIEE